MLSLFLILAALVPIGIWIYLLTARGGFWRVSRNLAPSVPVFAEDRKIAVVIPARDEESVIADAVRSLLAQSWTSSLRVFVVDDNSSDHTAAAAARVQDDDTVTVLQGKPLVAGWTGKLWALSQGVEKALALNPDYLLFTDADIVHDPDNVKTLVGIAETQGYDLVSFMVKLSSHTFAERLLIPAFVFFFFQLYPPAWIRSRTNRTAGAAGGCVLIRPSALRGIGGLASIRSQVIDDCALARAVKRNGGRVWLGLSPLTRSTRVYRSFAEVGAMISRTAFNQLQHSLMLLLATLLGLLFTFVLPVILFGSGNLTLATLGAAAWMLMGVAYFPMVRFYGLSTLWALTLPLSAIFYLGATIASAIRYWRGVGGNWKGRAQDFAS